jgi:hypothetical protein
LHGLGTLRTTELIIENVLKGCWTGHAGGKNFSFVTGGVGEAAQIAEIIGSSRESPENINLDIDWLRIWLSQTVDENVQVTQPVRRNYYIS